VNQADLVRLIDALEDRGDSYLTLDDVEAAAGQSMDDAIAAHLLLVDYRTSLDGRHVTVCRLNRRHPLVVQLTAW
jgi:hypothetical protein